MTKIGDTVRFLNATGGGIIRRIEGKIAYVEDSDGFETPCMIKDLVTVMPAGHEPSGPKGAKIMFDQAAFDAGRKTAPKQPQKISETPAQIEPVVETKYGNRLNIYLAFEPGDIKNPAASEFSAVLVNDSNYFLDFIFLSAGPDGEYCIVYKNTAAPNELVDLAVYTHEDLGSLEKVALQYIAYKQNGPFSLKVPGTIRLKIDGTKFYKAHCFRPSKYFDVPVMEIPIVSNDIPAETDPVGKPADIRTTMRPDPEFERQLKQKYNVSHSHKRQPKPETNPHKLLPLIEIDLHADSLLDSKSGMSASDILTYQLDTIRATMKSHSQRIGQKIVFIHGKGEGVLRNEMLKLLKREYPKAEIQDASFREYGFGASLITIR